MLGSSTKETILSAAVALLGEHGYEALTGPQVARRAKVRQSHVTYYFPKRSDLLKAVAERYAETIAALVAQSAADGASGPELATALISDRARTRSLLGLLIGSENDPALRKQLIGTARRTQQMLAALLGKPPRDPAGALAQATLWGLGLQHLLLSDQTAEELQALVALAGRAAGLGLKKKGRAA